MQIINRIDNELFGELVCVGEENGSPLYWGIEETINLLSDEKRKIMIALDIYCYNKEFKAVWDSKEEVDRIVNNIYQQYKDFKNDLKELDNIFITTFNEEKEEWDIDTNIETKEDVYTKLTVVKVDILKEMYVINFLLENEEWSLVKYCRGGGKPYFYLNPTEEAEFAEMDYK